MVSRPLPVTTSRPRGAHPSLPATATGGPPLDGTAKMRLAPGSAGKTWVPSPETATPSGPTRGAPDASLTTAPPAAGTLNTAGAFPALAVKWTVDPSALGAASSGCWNPLRATTSTLLMAASPRTGACPNTTPTFLGHVNHGMRGSGDREGAGSPCRTSTRSSLARVGRSRTPPWDPNYPDHHAQDGPVDVDDLLRRVDRNHHDRLPPGGQHRGDLGTHQCRSEHQRHGRSGLTGTERADPRWGSRHGPDCQRRPRDRQHRGSRSDERHRSFVRERHRQLSVNGLGSS